MVRLAAAGAIALACLSVRAQVSEIPLLSYPGHGDLLNAGLTVGPDGTLYGSSLFGRIFRVSPSGAGFKILFQLPVGEEVHYRLSLASDGALYGTTDSGGTNDDGTVFKINPDGTGYDVICQFGAWLSECGRTDNSPGLIQARDGALYGAFYDSFGSPDQEQHGFVYRVNPDGSGFKMLHVFRGWDNADGEEPCGLLVQGPDGALYGTTSGGGVFPYSWLNIIGGGMIQGPPGVVFKINPDGTGYRILHGFGDPAIYPASDGAWPLAGLTLGRDGALYGTTTIGGDNGAGTLFSINPDGTGYASLCSFSDQSPQGLPNWTDALSYNSPSRELLLASDGAFYGTIEKGGQWGMGEVFRYDPVNTNITEVYSFTGTGGDGFWPRAALVQGLDGAFYGTTGGDGHSSSGTVFRLAAHGLGGDWRRPLFTSITELSPGSVQVQLGGARNCSYRLDGSVNLVDWQPLTTFNNTNGLMEWTDLDAVNYPYRFYRAALVP